MKTQDRDLKINWHPYTQMKNAIPPLVIQRAQGAQLFDDEGKSYIDATSSWWVNLHGHCHPTLMGALTAQAKTLDHVLFAGCTHEPAVNLSEGLLKILPSNQSHIFYSDNGSTAVEVALKMAFQFFENQNQAKSKIVALRGAYHGDTFGAMSVSERGPFTRPFQEFLFETEYLDFPDESNHTVLVDQLRKVLSKKNVAAFIFEPLVQGVAGFRMYSPQLLNTLISVCHEFGVLAIADEVMTGFMRTGKMWACDYIDENPDIICISKGITGGVLPLGVTSVTSQIFEAFLSEKREKTFFHGHSYTANPLACSVALANLGLLQKPECAESVKMISASHRQKAEEIRGSVAVQDVRSLGTILAIELKLRDQELQTLDRVMTAAITQAREKGVLLRPLNSVLYTLPPYCTRPDELSLIYETMQDAVGIAERDL